MYKKIMDCNYTVDEIVKDMKVINISDYNMTIGGWNGWHTEPLQRFIDPILEKYLELNLKTNTPNWYNRISSSEEFVLRVTDKQGNPREGWDNRIDLTYFFNQHNIKSNLEFINQFEQN